MTEFKRRTLFLSTGKQLKLYGNSLAIGASLEIGEGSAPNIYSFIETQNDSPAAQPFSSERKDEKTIDNKPEKKTAPGVLNPHHLTRDDLMEIADYNIRLWLDLKDNLRKYGPGNPKIFHRDT